MDVVGFCPMGCGQTLFLGDGGHITCSYVDCPEPAAVDLLLAESDTRHLVRIEDDHFTVNHPLRERVDGSMFACDLFLTIRASDGPPVEPGWYRVHAEDGEMAYEAVDPPTP